MTIGISKERLKEIGRRYMPDSVLLAFLEECAELNPWLPIDESTPKGRRILLFYPSGISYIGMVCEGEYYPIETPIRMEPEQPTHWQELPEDPK